MKDSSKNNVFVFIYIFISFLFSLVITEIFLKVYNQRNTLSPESIKRHIRFRSYEIGLEVYVEPNDDYLSYTSNLPKRDYRVKIDSLGYIYPSYINENPDFNILFLGGSTTECVFVNEYKRWPYLIIDHFEKKGIKINSLNGGVSGNHSLHTINKLLNSDLKNDIDIAVFMHNINDLTTLLYEKSYWSNNASRSLIVKTNDNKDITLKKFIRMIIPNTYERIWILKNKIFNSKNISKDEWAHMRDKYVEINKDSILEDFQKSLMLFIEICLIYDIKPVLMTQANRIKENPDKKILQKIEDNIFIKGGDIYSSYKKIYDSMNDKIRQVASLKNIPLIDLDEIVPKDSLYIYDLVHYSEFGSNFVSEKIFEKIYLLSDEINIQKKD